MIKTREEAANYTQDSPSPQPLRGMRGSPTKPSRFDSLLSGPTRTPTQATPNEAATQQRF